MGLPPLRTTNVSTFTEPDRKHLRYASGPIAGVGTGVVTNANAPIRCDATHVALIDEVVMTAQLNDTATNVTCSLHVNGATEGELGAPATVPAHQLKFHFPGIADATGVRRSDRIFLQPRGNLVVRPSSTLWVQASAAGVVGCHIKYRMKGLLDAYRDGDLRPGGQMPAVASTNSVAGGGTIAATAKRIVAEEPVATTAIEVLGLYLTGHNFNAAADDIRIGFWDGSTGGSFAAGGVMIFRGWAQGASNVHQPRVLIDDTRGCIQGPMGWGLWIQASTNLAGATPTADYNVVYRRVAVQEVSANGIGLVGQTPTVRKKFWFYTQAAAGLTPVPFFATPGFGDETAMLKIHGHAFSCTNTDAATSVIGLTVGALGFPVSEYTVVGGDGDGNAASSSGARVGLNALEQMGVEPGFMAFDAAAAMTNRCQLAWGTFRAGADTASRTTVLA